MVMLMLVFIKTADFDHRTSKQGKHCKRILFGQEDRKHCPAMVGDNAAAQSNAAAMFLYDFPRHPKAQSCAYVLLSGVERLKEFLAMRR